MTDIQSDLTPLQKDALKELGNIGAGHAATALAQLVGRPVGMSVPDVSVVPLEQVDELMGGWDQLVACISVKILGEARGVMLVLLSRRNALALANLLLGEESAGSRTLSEMGKSALQELGNILLGAYMTAVSNLLGLMMLPSVPNIGFDIAGAFVDMASEEMGDKKAHVIVVHTEFRESEREITGHLLFVPDKPTLDAMLAAVERLLGR
jgi:chemotaxis protein CheC